MPGHVYHFAVRAVDTKSRLGPFSEPRSIKLDKKWSLPHSTATPPKTTLNLISLPKSPQSPKATLVLPDNFFWNDYQALVMSRCWLKWSCSFLQSETSFQNCYHLCASCACIIMRVYRKWWQVTQVNIFIVCFSHEMSFLSCPLFVVVTEPFPIIQSHYVGPPVQQVGLSLVIGRGSWGVVLHVELWVLPLS